MKEENSSSIPDTGVAADVDKSDANEELSITHHIVAQSFQGPLPSPNVTSPIRRSSAWFSQENRG